MINPFVWRDDAYSVGIEIIDNQHKRLFEIGSQIYELTDDYSSYDNYDAIVKLVDELLEYTEYHFRTEEDMFEKFNYSETESHKEEHKKFLGKLDQVDLEQMDEDQEKVMKEILMFVFIWIMEHIKVTDTMYVDFIKEKLEN